ncbi:MAG TPA: NAD-dependent epimerase/dehydratase family protein [Dehalococcoidia bacterium]|jgi:UDP-glucose 4-epimerase|nr:NAD-dependent epimerase/dehydratase family protein [Dehalococcoidia bacterium]
MKALVTGCAGFIGSHLTERLLKEGFEVVGLDCFASYYARKIKERNIAAALAHKGFEFIEADILEVEEFPSVDYVFHEAAQPGVRGSWGEQFETYLRNNILATQKLLEFYKERKLKKFVYASSSSIYGNAELPLKEDTVPKPISPYGVTKLAGENLCHLYWINYGVPVLSLRYFTVYGPRQRPDMAIHKLVASISAGEEITIFGDGNQTRDFTYVDDVVEANIQAARSDIEGRVYNIGGGDTISVNNLVRLIGEILGQEAKVRYVAEQKGDVRHTWADIERARAELGWQPRVSIADGLRKYIDLVTP